MNRGFAFTLVFIVLLAKISADEKYSDKYDNINLDNILHNERLLKKYIQCLLDDDDRHCTPDGKDLRSIIPEALTNGCEKCTDKQKSGCEKVIKHLREHNQEDWEKLEAKWDPEGVFRAKFAEKSE